MHTEKLRTRAPRDLAFALETPDIEGKHRSSASGLFLCTVLCLADVATLGSVGDPLVL
jgi:hypothetical protein